ncbi:monooxygenase [Aspergillus keveii]|uniref:Monooxygenase n=1 Tax=Aspergillus keveii TaxID=714993 RepID=A0ABR4FS60_9EURO
MVFANCLPPERHPETNIRVLVVGAGLGGLFCAIELWRHGHSVQVIEMKNEIEGLGDFVGIAPSATRQMAKWPGMLEVYNSIIYRPSLAIYKHDGELLGGPFPIQEGVDHLPTPVSRPKLIKTLYEYVRLLGIRVSFGKKVVEYYEVLDKKHAGVVTENQEQFEADLVIAADGVGSVSWKQTAGQVEAPRSSGFSVFRVAYPTSLTYQNPMLAEQYALKEGDDDICNLFLGKNTHGIILVARDTTTWMLTHKDQGQATELWSRRIDAWTVLEELKETGVAWDERFLAVICQSPPQSVVDYKLLWRNPSSTWTSPGGLVLQLGDAAHSFLPTSANGATQAMEDAISIAACLRLGGRNSIALATRVHTRLRYQRVSCAQRSGFKNREKWHHTDFDAVQKNPETLAMTVGSWIAKHDPEAYVYDRWEECVNHLLNGTPFENTNIPPGYTYAPWTIDELLQAAEEERETVDSGDWS